MKKIVFILVVSVITLTTSCAKEQCECTVNGQTQTFTEDDISNGSTVEEACDDSDKLNKSAGTGSCKMI
ncbi:MAG: hypothetical protein J5I47_09690 [Vicingus serpentipes]|nr:hypothetical protein [Vicingus serpentipes]